MNQFCQGRIPNESLVKVGAHQTLHLLQVAENMVIVTVLDSWHRSHRLQEDLDGCAFLRPYERILQFLSLAIIAHLSGITFFY